MILVIESALSLNETIQYNIGLHTFKLPTSTNTFYD